MKAIGLATIILLRLLASITYPATARFISQVEPLPPQSPTSTEPAVYPFPRSKQGTISIRALSGASVEFWTQNGRKVDNKPAEGKTIPRFVLFRNGALTDPVERTLLLSFDDIEISPSGAWLTASVTTEHSDPDQNLPIVNTFEIIRASIWLTGTHQGAGSHMELSFEIDRTTPAGDETIVTPTDYYRIEVEISENNPEIGKPVDKLIIEYAFLLENEWQTDLPEVPEAASGASPDNLIVYYCDMTPFHNRLYNPQTKLPRGAVPAFVAGEVIPTFIEAYQRMGAEWGFTWHAEWTSSRSGGNREALSIALSDGRTWYHGRAPAAGYAGITIAVAPRYEEKASYPSLIQKISGTIQHELFHNFQRSLVLHFTGNDAIAGAEGAWSIFSEGTATMIPTVLDAQHQLSSNSGIHKYLYSASKYILDDLNRSYRGMNPYHAALYWRFLYEQCSGLKEGRENPAQGMQVIKHILETLYSGEIVNIQTSQEIVENFPGIIDHGLAGSPCAVGTFQESLLAFTRAIYALRFEEHLRQDPGFPILAQLADPHSAYPKAAVEKVYFSGVPMKFSGDIHGSYGMDFIEINLDRQLADNPIELTFSAPGGETAFAVQVITLDESQRPILSGNETTLFYKSVAGDGTSISLHSYNHPGIRCIALLITRLDANEAADPLGVYIIQLK